MKDSAKKIYLSDYLKEPNGKPSATRLFCLLALTLAFVMCLSAVALNLVTGVDPTPWVYVSGGVAAGAIGGKALHKNNEGENHEPPQQTFS